MIIVTSGARYIDIDAYAGCIAYAELLNLRGQPAIAASTAPWNESIPSMIRALDAPLATNYVQQDEDQYVLIDLSDPKEFDHIVDSEKVIAVIDHHPGFEEYWSQRIGEGSTIDFIGAAATLVYEQWQAAGKTGQMSQATAQLLMAGILDNTLNFGAGVTTDRDKAAYTFLKNYTGLDDQWVKQYFTECQEAIFDDLQTSLQNDTKFLQFEGLSHELCLGQMVIWDAQEVLRNNLEVITSTLSGMRDTWLANIVSISEGKSYFVSGDTAVRQWLETLIGVNFVDQIAVADRLWLRKEIMKLGNGK